MYNSLNDGLSRTINEPIADLTHAIAKITNDLNEDELALIEPGNQLIMDLAILIRVDPRFKIIFSNWVVLSNQNS